MLLVIIDQFANLIDKKINLLNHLFRNLCEVSLENSFMVRDAASIELDLQNLS